MTSLALEETSAAEAGLGETLGKYRLLRHLATGGMAEIYLAEQVGPEGFAKEIVIKRILPHLAKDKTFTAMFLDEARLAANLNHPHIGQIYELGETDDDYYIAMEFIDGASLEELLAADIKLPPDVAARIIVDVLQALEFAHGSKDRKGRPLGIVHRDVTPSNVMVSIDGIVKLVDFGVAKAAKKDHKTQTGAVKGKFAYMAPEQVESQDVDRRADIFAIGIVFFELLTGERPFGEDLAAVSRILHEDAKNPMELNPEIPEPFARVVMRALQKDKDDRYPTAHHMLLDVETALRLENSYAGPREISRVIRLFRGESHTPGLGALDTGVFATDRSGELPAPDTATGTNIALLETAAISVTAPGTNDSGASVTFTVPPGVWSALRKAAPFLAAGLVVTLLAAGGAWAVAGRESTSDLVTGSPHTVVLNTTPLVSDDTKPKALFDKGGRPVVIESVPSTEIYKSGKLVGRTPFQTTLSPGRHRIELHLGEEKKTAEFTVADSGMSRAYFEFARLGQKNSKPASKRKKRRGRSLKSRLKGLLH